MLTLYPSIKPYVTHQFRADPTHLLYIEESGNPKGMPVVFLHGGPGAGCQPDHRRYFDPSLYRIILFDQRGAGQSTPHAELKDNTTQALVTDLEDIRQFLNVEKWLLFGGSWGTTLALVYAQAYPENVISMVLRGTFLARPQDIAWLYQEGGASRIFPDHWENFVQHLPERERSEILQSYYQRLTSKDELARMGAAKAWSQWEGLCSTFHPCPEVLQHFTQPHTAVSLACIETHYFMNNSFLEPNQILKNAHKLANIPGYIIHGRYDVVCPLEGAYALNKAWPKAELQIIRDAGHVASEPGMIHALVSATNRIVG